MEHLDTLHMLASLLQLIPMLSNFLRHELISSFNLLSLSMVKLRSRFPRLFWYLQLERFQGGRI